jgi:hypothetical protein
MIARVIIVSALVLTACSSDPVTTPSVPDVVDASRGGGGTGGAAGSASHGGGGAGGAAGGGGRAVGGAKTDEDGAAPEAGSPGSSFDAADASSDQSPLNMGLVDATKVNRKVLFVAGEMPMVGVDLQIHELLKTKNIEVEDVRETVAPASAQGKGLIIVSYSVLSTTFKAADFADLPVPLMVLEHFLLPDLGMTSVDGHGFEPDVTQITLTSHDPTLTAGLPAGDVTVYSQVGEFFWGVPSAAAITVATVKGNPTRAVTFAYPAGAMMFGRVAPAKRMQFFAAVHAPPPNPQPFLNEQGLALLGAAIDWCLQ